MINHQGNKFLTLRKLALQLDDRVRRAAAALIVGLTGSGGRRFGIVRVLPVAKGVVRRVDPARRGDPGISRRFRGGASAQCKGCGIGRSRAGVTDVSGSFRHHDSRRKHRKVHAAVIPEERIAFAARRALSGLPFQAARTVDIVFTRIDAEVDAALDHVVAPVVIQRCGANAAQQVRQPVHPGRNHLHDSQDVHILIRQQHRDECIQPPYPGTSCGIGEVASTP